MLDIHYKVDDGIKVISPPSPSPSPTYMTFGPIIPAQLVIHHQLDTRNRFQKIIDAWQPLEWTIWVLAKIMLPRRETQT